MANRKIARHLRISPWERKAQKKELSFEKILINEEYEIPQVYSSVFIDDSVRNNYQASEQPDPIEKTSEAFLIMMPNLGDGGRRINHVEPTYLAEQLGYESPISSKQERDCIISIALGRAPSEKIFDSYRRRTTIK